MARVHIPAPEHISVHRPVDPFIPFIMSNDDDYLDGHNAFLRARCTGRVDPRDVTRTVLSPKRLAFSSSMQSAYFLADFQTFCETEDAHPDIGIIETQDVKEWHILDLYNNAMHRGFWTASFYDKGIAQPLNPLTTINPRLKENMRCFLWLAAKGYISDFQLEPAFEKVRTSLSASDESFMAVAAPSENAPKRRVRNSPGKTIIPSPIEMIDWMNALPRGSIRIAAIGIHEHGFRRAEICHAPLREGYTHIRDQAVLRKLNMWHTSWNDLPLKLEHNIYDDQMIGVLPGRNWRSEPTDKDPQFRIVGKGNVVRMINLKRGWLVRLEKYEDTDRTTHLARRKDGIRPANLLIDRDGMPLKPAALYMAFVRASKNTGLLHITPHVLRHIFACRFLQNSIQVDARRHGLEIEDLTRGEIAEFAEMPLEVLRLELGHASIDTTRLYIEMLISSWIAPRYHRAWDDVLDGVE
jgi:hypothetical protein